MAFLAGLFLLLPGVFAMIHGADGVPPLPFWLLRDLAVTSLCGAALMVWGGVLVRQHELARNDLQPIRIRARR